MMSLLRFLRFLFISLPLIALLSILWPVASLLLWLFDRAGDNQLRLARLWAKVLLAVSFIRVQCTGLEKLHAVGPCTLVANHPSYLDIPVLLFALPLAYRFFVAKQLFRNPWLAIQCRAGGHVPVGGADSTLPLTSINRAIRLIAEHGIPIMIFPEEPHTDPALHTFREGAAYISIKAGVPVVPMALLGTRQLMHMGGMYLCGGTITLTVGEPISTAGLHTSDRGPLTQHLYDQISQLLNTGGKAT